MKRHTIIDILKQSNHAGMILFITSWICAAIGIICIQTQGKWGVLLAFFAQISHLDIVYWKVFLLTFVFVGLISGIFAWIAQHQRKMWVPTLINFWYVLLLTLSIVAPSATYIE